MKTTLRKILKLTSILLIIMQGCEPSGQEKLPHDVGFTVFQTKDKSRIYKPETDTTDYLHFRPLDIDFWYPAKPSQAAAMTFREILGLLEQRANYYTASSVGDGLTRQVAQYFCEGLKCSDTTRLLNFRTRSYKNAAPIEKKFPLVIYLSSYNGMGYENFMLFEELAKRGFAVASINSIGRYPGDMTMKNEDLSEQVDDALATLKFLEQKQNIDFSKIGIIGYSWGGLSASLLASKTPNASCIISFDGSEFHHYGQLEEDEDFEQIRNSMDFRRMTLAMPYLRLESSSPTGSGTTDSIYDFSGKLARDVFILKVDSAVHEDFSCLPVVVRTSGECKNNELFNTIAKLTIGFLEEHLKSASPFSQTLKQEMNRTVREN